MLTVQLCIYHLCLKLLHTKQALTKTSSASSTQESQYLSASIQMLWKLFHFWFFTNVNNLFADVTVESDWVYQQMQNFHIKIFSCFRWAWQTPSPHALTQPKAICTENVQTSSERCMWDRLSTNQISSRKNAWANPAIYRALHPWLSWQKGPYLLAEKSSPSYYSVNKRHETRREPFIVITISINNWVYGIYSRCVIWLCLDLCIHQTADLKQTYAASSEALPNCPLDSESSASGGIASKTQKTSFCSFYWSCCQDTQGFIAFGRILILYDARDRNDGCLVERRKASKEHSNLFLTVLSVWYNSVHESIFLHGSVDQWMHRQVVLHAPVVLLSDTFCCQWGCFAFPLDGKNLIHQHWPCRGICDNAKLFSGQTNVQQNAKLKRCPKAVRMSTPESGAINITYKCSEASHGYLPSAGP